MPRSSKKNLARELRQKKQENKNIWDRETGNNVLKEEHDERAEAESVKLKQRINDEDNEKRKLLSEREQHLQALADLELGSDPSKNGTINDRHASLEKNAIWEQPENPLETLKRHQKPLEDRLTEARKDEKTWKNRGDGMRTAPVRENRHRVHAGAVDMGSLEERKNGAVTHGKGYFEVEIKKQTKLDPEPAEAAKRVGNTKRLQDLKASKDEWAYKGDGMRTDAVRELPQHAGKQPNFTDAKVEVAKSMIEVNKAIDADSENVKSAKALSLAARFERGRDKHDQWKANGDGMRGIKSNEDGGREHTDDGFNGNKARLESVFASQNDWKDKGDGMRGLKVNDDGGIENTVDHMGSREERKRALMVSDTVMTAKDVDHWKEKHGMRPKIDTLSRPPKSDNTCRWYT